MSGHAAAWDAFLAYVVDARRRLEDRWAPVALVCVQARQGRDGATNLFPEKDAAIVWPASFPVQERGPLLRRMARPYGEGTVLRS